jgi:glycosyltransferase involved in cell wall biosynthesis
LIEGLREYGVEVDLWSAGCFSESADRSGALPVLDVAGNIPHPDVRKVAKGGEYLFNLAVLHWKMRMESPEIIHYQWLPFTENFPIIEVLNLKLAKRSGAGVIHTVHNVLPHDTEEQYRDVFQRIYQIPDALICHTKESRQRLVQNFGVSSSNVWVIPHGPLSSDLPSVSRQEARERLQVASRVPLCLLFGHIRPYKGVEFLLESWYQVKKRVPAARLVLAGKPEKKYEQVLWSKMEELGLENEVDTHFKFLPKKELDLWVQAADILVYPYRDITQSGALLKGLATGKPVLATDIGGFRETIRHDETGVLVEYGKPNQMSNAIVRLLGDRDKRDKLGRKGREMVATEYSWGEIARKTMKCYQSVID